MLSLSSDLLPRNPPLVGTQPGQANRGSALKRPNELPFASTDALLEFVTKRWRERWVIANIDDEETLEALWRRPFFILISVDAPLGERWQRWQRK